MQFVQFSAIFVLKVFLATLVSLWYPPPPRITNAGA